MRNWKSTLAGAITGAMPILLQVYHRLEYGIPVDWGLVLFGVGIMVLGAVSKDYNVTGTGGKGQS